MNNDDLPLKSFHIKPLTHDRWNDLATLFGEHGAYGGCWCMFFRQKQAEYSKNCGETNKMLFQGVVESGQPVGLIAYSDDYPIGWIAISPRENYGRINRSRIYKRIDDQPVWSITCFFTAPGYRRLGVTRYLISEAIYYARGLGCKIIEAYPAIPKTNSIPDGDAYTGVFEVFLTLGFIEVARRSANAPVVRYYID